MVNQEKIILMTKAEAFEERESKKSISINRSTRWTYVSWRVIKALLFGLIGMVLCFLLWAAVNSEILLTKYDFEGLFELGKEWLLLATVILPILGVIAVITYTDRYKKARILVKKYFLTLIEIDRINGSASAKKKNAGGKKK